jgi:hypothetical protein
VSEPDEPDVWREIDELHERKRREALERAARDAAAQPDDDVEPSTQKPD